MGIRNAILNASRAIEHDSNYRSTNSLAKAVRYLEAVDVLLALRPNSQSRGGTTTEEMRFDHNSLLRMRQEVKQFIAVRQQRARTNYDFMSFKCYRD